MGQNRRINVSRRLRRKRDSSGIILKRLQADGVDQMNICLDVRTQSLLDSYGEQLRPDGIKTYEIKRSKTGDRDISGVWLATIHRVKGTEFDYMIMAGVNNETMPWKWRLKKEAGNRSS
jgi:superfamily I DNA/RNA helicase